MYEEQVEFIEQFMRFIESELPDAFAFISEETVGASTGLEYHDMLRGAVKKAYRKGLIPLKFKREVKKLDKAIEYIFTS